MVKRSPGKVGNKDFALETRPEIMSKETVGEFLKRERELRKISLKEVAEGTKISVQRLQVIEENRFDDLPAEVFVRGFIKNYAEYIGIDPADAIMKLDEDLKEQGLAAVQQEIPSPQFDLERKSPQRFMLLAAGGVVIILIIAAIYFLLSPSDSGKSLINNTMTSISKTTGTEKNDISKPAYPIDSPHKKPEKTNKSLKEPDQEHKKSSDNKSSNSTSAN